MRSSQPKRGVRQARQRGDIRGRHILRTDQDTVAIKRENSVSAPGHHVMVLTINRRRHRSIHSARPQSVALQFAIGILRECHPDQFEGWVRSLAWTNIEHATPVWKRM